MAPLWHFMEECASWYGTPGCVRPDKLDVSALDHPQWDWATVAVATCSANCDLSDSEWTVAPEATAGLNIARQSSSAQLLQSDEIDKAGTSCRVDATSGEKAMQTCVGQQLP